MLELTLDSCGPGSSSNHIFFTLPVISFLRCFYPVALRPERKVSQYALRGAAPFKPPEVHGREGKGLVFPLYTHFARQADLVADLSMWRRWVLFLLSPSCGCPTVSYLSFSRDDFKATWNTVVSVRFFDVFLSRFCL